MRWRRVFVGRGAFFSFLCLAAAAVPGIAPESQPTSLPAYAAALAPVVSNTSGTDPAPVVDPGAPPPAAGALVLGELTSRAAPVPAGPSTYLPILLYHYIRVNPNPADRVGFNLSTTPSNFRLQMQYLADHSFHVLSLREAVDAIAAHQLLPSHPVVLTFDDGYADFFTAAVPVMRAHSFTATDFVISGRMGLPGFMSPAQVLAADGLGFNIGAHTVDHYALTVLTPARAAWEIRQSKLSLESLLGHPVLDFAYPYGSYNAYDAALARRGGFECALSTLVGTVHTPGQLMFLSRVRIGGAMSLPFFAHLVGGPAPAPGESR